MCCHYSCHRALQTSNVINILTEVRCCYGDFAISASQSYTIAVNYFIIMVVVKWLNLLLYLHLFIVIVLKVIFAIFLVLKVVHKYALLEII